MAKAVRMFCAARFRTGGALTIEMLVDPDDPFRIIRTIFRFPDGGAEWDISFDLIGTLFEQMEAGEGDILLALEVDEVSLVLRSEDESVELLLPLKELQRFHGKVKRLPAPRRAVDDIINKAIEQLRP